MPRTRKTTGNPPGRPQIKIDENQFTKLCELQCTEEEIAGWFECSVDTIERWCKRTFDCSFAEIYRQKATRGKIALRRIQMQHAQKNPSMAIFLGKNWLGQSDRVEQTATIEVEDLSPLAAMLAGNDEDVAYDATIIEPDTE